MPKHRIHRTIECIISGESEIYYIDYLVRRRCLNSSDSDAGGARELDEFIGVTTLRTVFIVKK